ncbi:serine/threonine-protein kinase [Corynebacterium rouxii]|uniref:non-specific serine/threonine protein kinase n=1 Tax=Corynebacterium rouxii TaxID=2719119 RepID=A0ABU3PJE9_9CORY|nr:protein kinase [Corynebacterium rouxii]MDT9407784.1 protein kinase [Corynebacterium rouxii]MDT9409966.1 protein kinase [Corynebacterium rouxii]
MTQSQSPDPALQALVGSDYALQWVVGNGGMSTVWLADDLRNQREVAIKVLRPEFSDNEEFLSRFRNEALASEHIDSVNVVRTYDYREVTDDMGRTLCFIVMEYVRGESLADMLARKGRLEEELALDVLEQAAHGLSIIHRMGMVHRDIKPGNLLITQNGQVKITDFGIAKAAAAVPLTRTGMVVGTAQYVSPEQAQGRDVTAATDVYSLGVVGYEMLVGQRPFNGDSSVSVAIAHINQAPPAMPTSVSAPARELIGIALRKDPAHRYADGNELALAVSATRMGQRPPQPKSAPLQHIAPQPAPTESTYALGATAQPTTVIPATGQVPAASAAAAAYPASTVIPAGTPRQEPEKQSSGWGAGIVVGALAALLLGTAAWAASQGMFDDLFDKTPQSSESSVPPPPVTATVTETPTPQITTVIPEPLPTSSPEPTPSETERTPDESRPTSAHQSPSVRPSHNGRPSSHAPHAPTQDADQPAESPAPDTLDSLIENLNKLNQGGAQ